MGVLQREPWELVKADGRHARWLAPWDVGPPGGESHADAVGRVCAALRRWDDGTPTLVVTHGSILRGLFAVLQGGMPGARPPVGNCEILRWSGPIVAIP
jgi:broad specificity phosphatase PhoE